MVPYKFAGFDDLVASSEWKPCMHNIEAEQF